MKKLFISIIFFLSINAYSQTVRPVSDLNKDASGISLSGLPNYYPTWNNEGTGLTPKSYLYAQSNRNVCLNCETTLYEGFFGGAGLTINDSTGSGNHVTLEGTFGGNDYHWSWAMSTLAGQPYFGLWNGLGGNFMAFTDYQFGNPRVRIGGGAFYANAGVVEIFELDTNNTSLPLRITSKGNPGWMISSADTSNCNKCDWSFGINRDDDFKFSINNKLNTLTDNRTLSIDTTGKVVINNRLQIDNPISLSNAIGNDILPKVKNDSLYKDFSSLLNPYVILRDEFIFGMGETGEIGELGWTSKNGINEIWSNEQNRPGIVGRTSNASGQFVVTIPGAASIQTSLRYDEFDELIFIFDLPTVGSDADYKFGLVNETENNSPANGCYLEKLDTDTNWFFVSKASGVATRVNTGLTATALTWYKLRLRNISPTQVGFTLNNGSEIIVNTNVPAASTNLLFSAQMLTESVTVRGYRMDYFAMRSKNLTR